MKRIWSLLLVFCLLLSVLTAFSACDDENDIEKEKAPPVTTVTLSEWIDAFDLSDLQSFTVSVTERDAGGTEWEEAVTCEIQYRDGVAAIELCVREDGMAEDREICYFKTEFRNLVDLDMDILEEIAFALEDRADYGYSLFTYSEETKSYHASTSWTPFENERIEIGFEDGNIVRILFEANGAYDGVAVEIYSLTEFTKIDCTKRVAMPTEKAETALSQAQDSILTATDYFVRGCDGYSDAEILRAFYYLLEDLDFDAMISYGERRDGRRISMEFAYDGSETTFLETPLELEDVSVSIRNGRIDSVWIGTDIWITEIEY